MVESRCIRRTPSSSASRSSTGVVRTAAPWTKSVAPTALVAHRRTGCERLPHGETEGLVLARLDQQVGFGHQTSDVVVGQRAQHGRHVRLDVVEQRAIVRPLRVAADELDVDASFEIGEPMREGHDLLDALPRRHAGDEHDGVRASRSVILEGPAIEIDRVGREHRAGSFDPVVGEQLLTERRGRCRRPGRRGEHGRAGGTCGSRGSDAQLPFSSEAHIDGGARTRGGTNATRPQRVSPGAGRSVGASTGVA